MLGIIRFGCYVTKLMWYNVFLLLFTDLSRRVLPQPMLHNTAKFNVM